MDFWCHASALLALSWCDSDLIKRRMLVAGQQLCARPRAHSGFTEHTERHRGEQHLR